MSLICKRNQIWKVSDAHIPNNVESIRNLHSLTSQLIDVFQSGSNESNMHDTPSGHIYMST